MKILEKGSILSPLGFRAGASRCGLKSDRTALDIAVMLGESELSAAGVFTKNLFSAPPVLWSQSILPSDNLKGICVCSGNANACTGPGGFRDTETMAKSVSRLAGCKPSQIAVASTGIIGRTLPMAKVKTGLGKAYEALSGESRAALDAENAILTTDTGPKSIAVCVEAGGKSFSVGGMAKGAGMIAPDMATMLAFITTDIDAGGIQLKELLAKSNSKTFNRITIDGDTSTNDSVFLMASGCSGVRLKENGVEQLFAEALHYVMNSLAVQIASDGEGATVLVAVKVSGAYTEQDAERVAGAVANSLLVKCALNGRDPNWGRIICAAGRSGAYFRPEKLELFLGDVCVFKDGMPTGKDGFEGIDDEKIVIDIRLGDGDADATFWTCDISKEYVEINADYHS